MANNNTLAAIGVGGNTNLPSRINPYLDKGWSYEDISRDTGLDWGLIRDYADATRPGYGVSTSSNNNSYTQNNTPAYDPSAAARAQQQAAANLQIDQINRLLGILDTQETSGINNINAGYGENKRRLTEDQTRANQGYTDQRNQNAKAKERGINQVDDFANSSYNSLQRLLQGAGAGVSGVSKYLAPHLVSKAAGKRRTGVFETAGENAQAIDKANKEADIQFARSFSDLDTQKSTAEQGFKSGIQNQRLDLLGQLLGLQSDAGLATAGTEAQLANRATQLQQLFGGYNPTFTTKAVNLTTPELAQYQVDPAQIRLGNQGPAETRYYNPLLKKREELRG